jgi:hypothetical protein
MRTPYSKPARPSVALITLLSLALYPGIQAQTADQQPETKKEASPVATEKKPALSDADLAKDLQNPVAGLISVPLENRFDLGPGSSWRYTLNVQPVLPFELSSDWLLVSRTILPVVCARQPTAEDPVLDSVGLSPVGDGPRLGGIGDVTQSFFFVPKEAGNGWIWGAGPVLRVPTASRNEFGEGQWGLGPTAVVLRQEGPWTYGMLANHIWSFAGWGPENVSTTALQPFLAYTTGSLTTFGLGTETGYDWVHRQAVVPVDLTVSQLVRVGNMPLELGFGVRFYADRPDGGPNWGLKLTITFLFSK